MSSLAELGPAGYLGLAQASRRSPAVCPHWDSTSRSRVWRDHLGWCLGERLRQKSWQEEGGFGGPLQGD
jgi:hypothetical protein